MENGVVGMSIEDGNAVVVSQGVSVIYVKADAISYR